MRLDHGPVRPVVQIVPRRFMDLIADKDPTKVQPVTEAMLKMVKLDVATLEKAYADA